MKKIFIIAGEASGDLYGANLIQNIRKFSPEPLEIHGVGGEKIRATGALSFFDLAHFHVTGFSEVIKKIPQYKKAGLIILESIRRVNPDLVVLIDNPGFNLHLAAKIHAINIPVVYYISPQIWAWAPKRILKIKRAVRKVIVVFEFEKALYEKHGIPVRWVGHPLKDLIEAADTKMDRIPSGHPLISLLPGSRKGEIKKLLPLFLNSAELIARKFPKAEFFLLKSPTLPKSAYEKFLAKRNLTVTLIEKNAYAAIKASDVAIVCSGTATLECALLGTPLLISNRGSLLTYLAARALIRVPYIGLPNLILGEKKIPEILQYDATPRNLARETLRILENPELKESMKIDLADVSKRLGPLGAANRAAEEILKELSLTKREDIPSAHNR
jgi:lipid-A-disaccharide synthase